MKCHYCDSDATVHLTKVVKKVKQEVHLCQACAEKQFATPASELSLSTILQTLIGQHVGPQPEELSRLNCPTCGIKYMEFRADGRLGCPSDYEHFRVGLLPILERVHRATRHAGKVPRRGGATGGPCDLLDLRQQLRKAVAAEDYELAARLRDTIREKEATDEPG